MLVGLLLLSWYVCKLYIYIVVCMSISSVLSLDYSMDPGEPSIPQLGVRGIHTANKKRREEAGRV